MDNEDINTTVQTSNQSSKKKVLFSFFLVVILLIAIAAIVLMPHTNETTTPAQTAVRTYHDKGGYFSIQIPDSWSVSEDTAQGTTGIGTPQQATQTIEEVQLSQAPDMGIAIQAYEGIPTCPLNEPVELSFAGFPASYDPPTTTWTIPTNKALITVSASYPGGQMIEHNLQQTGDTTPVPTDVVQKNKNTMMQILNTFKPVNVAPFKC